jgi:hypothetical protein
MALRSEFTSAQIPARHVLHQPGEGVIAVAESITTALDRGDLTYNWSR